jgi:hypothetical protein
MIIFIERRPLVPFSKDTGCTPSFGELLGLLSRIFQLKIFEKYPQSGKKSRGRILKNIKTPG